MHSQCANTPGKEVLYSSNFLVSEIDKRLLFKSKTIKLNKHTGSSRIPALHQSPIPQLLSGRETDADVVAARVSGAKTTAFL
jgi:hypothetical protein